MKIYIDFDGVICDTVSILLKDYYKLLEQEKDIELTKYIHDYDWKNLLEVAPIINNAIEHINSAVHDVSVLTRVHSFNEAQEKIKMLRKSGIKCEILIVPPYVEKSSVVIPNGAILVDDQLSNLYVWYNRGGYSLLFNKDGISYDSNGEYNDIFPIVDNLDFIADEDKILRRTR